MTGSILAEKKGVPRRQRGSEEAEVIKHISPVAWRHVNLIGKFKFQKQQNQLKIDEIISALKQKTEWQLLKATEDTPERTSYFTFLRG